MVRAGTFESLLFVNLPVCMDPSEPFAALRLYSSLACGGAAFADDQIITWF